WYSDVGCAWKEITGRKLLPVLLRGSRVLAKQLASKRLPRELYAETSPAAVGNGPPPPHEHSVPSRLAVVAVSIHETNSAIVRLAAVSRSKELGALASTAHAHLSCPMKSWRKRLPQFWYALCFRK